MNNTLSNLDLYFQHFDVTPEGWPARFDFCVPGPAAFERWPHYPAAARVEAGRAAGGRGLTPEACRLSGLGEAIEVASVSCWGDEQLHYAPYARLGDSAIDPQSLAGLTLQQIGSRDHWNETFGNLDWRGRPVAADEMIAWVVGRDRNGKERLVPAEADMIGYSNRGEPHAFVIADTCGCGAGEDADSARLAAVLEMIERDAIGRWWYGARRRACLDIAVVDGEPELVAFLAGRERRTTLYDITTDIGVPAVAAVSWNSDGRAVTMGFSARLSHKAAAIHALVEMLQGEIALAQRARIKDPFLPGWLEAVSANLPMLAVSEFVEPLSIGYDSVPNGLDICLDQLDTTGCDTFFVDHARPEFGVPVHRAVIPQLCRDKPRWNYDRLCAPDERDLSGPPRRDGAGDPPNRVPLMI